MPLCRPAIKADGEPGVTPEMAEAGAQIILDNTDEGCRIWARHVAKSVFLVMSEVSTIANPSPPQLEVSGE